jgi:hypothetical protein
MAPEIAALQQMTLWATSGKANKEINAGLADPKVKARLADLAHV